MPVSQALNSVRTGQYPWMSEPGLEAPFEQRLVNNLIAALSGATAPGMVGSVGVPAFQGLRGLGEAGAILPKAPSEIQQMMQTLTPAEQQYQKWLALANTHARNYDWANVLKDKWGLLKHSGGS